MDLGQIVRNFALALEVVDHRYPQAASQTVAAIASLDLQSVWGARRTETLLTRRAAITPS